MDRLFLIGLPGALAAAVFVLFQALPFFRRPPEGDSAGQLAGQLRREARPHLLGQALMVLVFASLGFAALAAFTWAGLLDRFIPYAFLSGAAVTLLTALLAGRIVLRTAPKTVTATGDTLNRAMSAAFSAGTVVSFTVAALSLAHITAWFWGLRYLAGYDAPQIAQTMLPCGLGALLTGLLLQLSGGLLPGYRVTDGQSGDRESDRTDLPGLSADLLGTCLSVLPAAFALGCTAFPNNGITWNAMLLPLAVAVAGILCSLIGVSRIQADEAAGQRSLLKTLHRGVFWAGALTAVVMAPITYLLLGSWRPYWAILAGIAAGCAIPALTEFFTAPYHRPGKLLAKSTQLGAASTTLEGLALGMGASALTGWVTLLAALVGFFALGGTRGGNSAPGLYGLALAMAGMLSTLPVTLATGAVSPVARCAQQIAQASETAGESRARLTLLDGLGGIALPAVRGFAACAAGLSALGLLSCCGGITGSDLPVLAVGALLGCLFCSLFAFFVLSRLCGRKGTSGEITQPLSPSLWDPLREIIPTALLGIAFPVAIRFLLGRTALLGLAFGALIVHSALGRSLSAAGYAWGNLLLGERIREEPAALTVDALGAPLRSGLCPALPALTKLWAGLTVLFWAMG